eukprot:CAMPEP_0196217626 /NCGR_PEP_ID=MMETSP0912-20130531/34821_1 /TAXON_ID=49265 /ORGANISM="Thalassiosira rotula, Strain GSO102" /LENGTH=55 /DNA_ID=CAMNT_0041495103 /DNA_START=224 /DNA_END=387 /DNA_ORIENTATION=+
MTNFNEDERSPPLAGFSSPSPHRFFQNNGTQPASKADHSIRRTSQRHQLDHRSPR